jgi:hypothetical protein
MKMDRVTGQPGRTARSAPARPDPGRKPAAVTAVPVTPRPAQPGPGLPGEPGLALPGEPGLALPGEPGPAPPGGRAAGPAVIPTVVLPARPGPPSRQQPGRPKPKKSAADVPVAAAEPGMTGILGQDQLHHPWPTLTAFTGLRADPLLAWWIRLAVVSVSVAAVMTVLTNWRIGITLAALAAAADSLYHARTRAVIPAAARVTSAQRRTRRRLARLAPSGYISLHGRMIPGTESVIDHLVIGPAGMYAVNSQRWDRRLPVRATQGGQLYHGPFDQADELRKARSQAGQASSLISEALGQPVTGRAAMVIYGPAVPWVAVKVSGVDVFCGRRLGKYLRREACANRTRRLDARQIELIHAAAAQVLPPVR